MSCISQRYPQRELICIAANTCRQHSQLEHVGKAGDHGPLGLLARIRLSFRLARPLGAGSDCDRAEEGLPAVVERNRIHLDVGRGRRVHRRHIHRRHRRAFSCYHDHRGPQPAGCSTRGLTETEDSAIPTKPGTETAGTSWRLRGRSLGGTHFPRWSLLRSASPELIRGRGMARVCRCHTSVQKRECAASARGARER